MTVTAISVDQVGDRWAYTIEGATPNDGRWEVRSAPIYRSRSSARRRAKRVAAWVVSGRAW